VESVESYSYLTAFIFLGSRERCGEFYSEHYKSIAGQRSNGDLSMITFWWGYDREVKKNL
jgi:hypothetical protein